MIDFDAMAASEVISSDTLQKIKAYMEANKPEDQPEMNGQPSETSGEVPELGTDLLDALLNNGIITQDEYDALVAAGTAAQTAEETAN